MATTQKMDLLSDVAVTGAGTASASVSGTKTYCASGLTTAGAGSATVLVQGSNDQDAWVTIGTITLTLGTTATADGFTSEDRFAFVRGNVSAISGTGAGVSLSAGY
jgi:hypothetical protein